MGFRFAHAALHSPLCGGNLKLLHIALADLVNEKSVTTTKDKDGNIISLTGRCYPSQAYLAKTTGLDEKTCRRLLAKLKELGVVSFDAKKGKQTYYELTITPEPTTGTMPELPKPTTGTMPELPKASTDILSASTDILSSTTDILSESTGTMPDKHSNNIESNIEKNREEDSTVHDNVSNNTVPPTKQESPSLSLSNSVVGDTKPVKPLSQCALELMMSVERKKAAMRPKRKIDEAAMSTQLSDTIQKAKPLFETARAKIQGTPLDAKLKADRKLRMRYLTELLAVTAWELPYTTATSQCFSLEWESFCAWWVAPETRKLISGLFPPKGEYPLATHKYDIALRSAVHSAITQIAERKAAQGRPLDTSHPGFGKLLMMCLTDAKDSVLADANETVLSDYTYYALHWREDYADELFFGGNEAVYAKRKLNQYYTAYLAPEKEILSELGFKVGAQERLYEGV